MIWRVEVKQKDGTLDPIGKSIARDIIDLGIDVCAGAGGVGFPVGRQYQPRGSQAYRR